MKIKMLCLFILATSHNGLKAMFSGFRHMQRCSSVASACVMPQNKAPMGILTFLAASDAEERAKEAKDDINAIGKEMKQMLTKIDKNVSAASQRIVALECTVARLEEVILSQAIKDKKN